jgi:GNAT superfamily N-acetyltransferase
MSISTIPGVGQVSVRRAELHEIVGLRHRILREGLPIETALFAGDDAANTYHIALFLIEKGDQPLPVCCATFMFNFYNERPAWQLRGMATEAAYQGKGLGTELLGFAEHILCRSEYTEARLMWCNARVPAVKFYEKNGWRCVSDVFDIPTAGPHREMVKQVGRHRDEDRS